MKIFREIDDDILVDITIPTGARLCITRTMGRARAGNKRIKCYAGIELSVEGLNSLDVEQSTIDF